MWRLWLLVGCGGSEAVMGSSRERDVLVEALPGTVVIYRDGDQPWELAPRVGDRFGFDVGAARYSVAAIDFANRRVDSLLTTVAEDADVRFAAKPIEVPVHRITGLVHGLGDAGGVAASPIESVPVQSDVPFVLRAPEGTASIVLARIDPSHPALVDALVVRRDLPVTGDLELVADFATEARRVSSLRVALPATVNTACSTRSTFDFGSTTILTSSLKPVARFPDQAQWLATDQLAFTLTCDAVDSFSERVRVATSPSSVPTRLDRPFDLGAVSVFVEDGNFAVAWQPYPAPTSFYELVLNNECESCARWTTRFKEAWIGDGSSSLELLSPTDLEALGVFDPALDLPADATFLLKAVVEEELQHTVAGRPGLVQRLP